MQSAQLSTFNAPETSIELQEGWSFTIEDYAIEHQGQAIIDVEVSYDYVNGIGVPDPLEYPDFVPINNFIEQFFVNYPNETDFWEILNKNLVTTLLTQPIPTPYGVEYKLDELLDSLTVKIDVESGAAGVNIPRSSIVTGSPKPKYANNEDGATALISDERDSVVKPALTEGTYDPLLNPPQALIASDHYDITDKDNLVYKPNRLTLDQATATEAIAQLSASFLQAQGNKGAFDYSYNVGDALDQNMSVIS
jgi:hypothetical protein